MRPSKDKFYRVDILELHSVIATVIKEFRVEFAVQDMRNLCLVCKEFEISYIVKGIVLMALAAAVTMVMARRYSVC